MNKKILSIIILIALKIYFITQNSLQFNPIRFQCKNYVLNTYLYIFLSFSIIFSSLLAIDENKINVKKLFLNSNYKHLFLFFTIILIVFINFINSKYFILKHLVWLIWLILIGFIIYPVYNHNSYIFYHSSIISFLILIFMSLISYNNLFQNTKINTQYLMISLFAIVFSQIVEKILKYKNIISKNIYNKLLSYLIIILFSIWTIKDTNIIINNSNNCNNPDYINESLNMLINSLNIFSAKTNITNS